MAKFNWRYVHYCYYNAKLYTHTCWLMSSTLMSALVVKDLKASSMSLTEVSVIREEGEREREGEKGEGEGEKAKER